MIADRHKKILDILNANLLLDLSDLDILEIGCGSGGVIREFVQFGAVPTKVVGVDLLLDRLEQATTDLKDCSWLNANGQFLPFRDATFELLLQFTAFSSILDPKVKMDMALEMLRVLKPGGSILWYDFTWNPTNSQTKGIGLKELKALFPGCALSHSRITLAPPLTRLLIQSSPRQVEWLSSLKMFNSHLLVWIQKGLSIV